LRLFEENIEMSSTMTCELLFGGKARYDRDCIEKGH